MKSYLAAAARMLSPGIFVVLVLGIVSAIIIALLPVPTHRGMQIWLGDGNHANLYRALAPEWNRRHPDLPLTVTLIAGPALQSRMLSGFYSGTPLPDLIEVERNQIGQVFAGPLKDVGFADLTDRLARDGLLDEISPASFSPWTTRGRIFGLPRGAHPVVLIYRSDLVEAAGIDVSQIETWDDYFRLMRPLLKDLDGDGYIDRYPLTISLTNASFSEIFLLQAGGGYFDASGNPQLNTPANVQVVARLATWYAGPGRVIGDINMYSGAGLRLLREGYAIAIPSADWFVGNLPITLPSLAGKIKVMPLPAWERGGRRSSVNGGTMIGVTKASKHPEVAWELAEFLYFSPVIARQLYDLTRIVSPVKSTWSAPYLDRPDPYFCGQPVGRILQQAVPAIPPRYSSPYLSSAVQLVNSVIGQLMSLTDRNGYVRPEQVTADAQRLLDEAQHTLIAQIHRNVFLAMPAPATP